MKCIPTLFLAVLALVCTISCANVSLPIGPGVAPAPGVAAAAPASMKLNLLGADLEQFQAAYPDGPQVAIAGLKTSPGLGLITNTVRDVVQWGAMSKIATGWFGQKNTEVTQAGLTRRAQVNADASVRTAELNLLKPVEAAAP